MKSFSLLALGQALLAVATPHGSELPVRQQGNSFAGVNSFFLHAFKQQDRLDVLDAIQDANLKVLRIFISPTGQNFKNTGSIAMPDIEPQTVGVWDDTQLRAIDQLMVEAQARGIKLTIAIHDRYQLGCWGSDAYVSKYKLPAVDCNTQPASANNVEFWYSDKNCISDFQNRIRHVLEHKNTLISGSPAWKDLNSHIFAFNIQNEGQGHLNNNIPPHPSWWCDRAGFMRGIMGSSKVLISTGGGNEFPNSDVAENWACKALDLVTIHSYMGVNEFKNKGPVALQHAKSANKLMLFEEFGATGSNVFNGLGVPWMPWQISKPGNKANDYEFWTDEPTYDVVEDGSNDALAIGAAQTWSI
ncbi:glycoside hydrolase superfamily [Fusarium oxysporum f. sp. albedinis]|nr:glycoside hydrolase superfamily [Fusarium oxysporum f. sp. albedinis]